MNLDISRIIGDFVVPLAELNWIYSASGSGDITYCEICNSDTPGTQSTIVVPSWVFLAAKGYNTGLCPLPFELEFSWRMQFVGKTANLQSSHIVGIDLPNLPDQETAMKAQMQAAAPFCS